MPLSCCPLLSDVRVLIHFSPSNLRCSASVHCSDNEDTKFSSSFSPGLKDPLHECRGGPVRRAAETSGCGVPSAIFKFFQVLQKACLVVWWKKVLNKINPEITLKLCVSMINTEGSQNRSELKTHGSGKVFFHLPSATCLALPPAAAPIPLQTHGCLSPSCSPRSFPASSADFFELAAALT